MHTKPFVSERSPQANDNGMNKRRYREVIIAHAKGAARQARHLACQGYVFACQRHSAFPTWRES